MNGPSTFARVKPMRFLARLARDPSGNAMAIIAAAIFPLLALVGSGIDMGRGYLAQSRLQQACDSGVLAARKRLGTNAAVDDTVPTIVADTGQRFFNINFRDGAYSSENREFIMVLEDDFAITGDASVDVPTTIMQVFGFTEMPISVSCVAQLSMSNTDIMMVLDTTGSMLQTNPGDTDDRITGLRNVVKSFHAQMEASKATGTRVRYGFLPYSTNVNVGHLLQADWMVDEWEYNYRLANNATTTSEVPTYEYQSNVVSGTSTSGTQYYAADCPPSSYTYSQLPQVTNADGWTITTSVYDGNAYSCSMVDSDTVRITPRVYDLYTIQSWRRQTGTTMVTSGTWAYKTYKHFDLSFLSSSNSTTVPMGGNPAAPTDVTVNYRGCVEERDTYEINDYGNVDLSQALDLDIDRVPTAGDASTQWRPMLNELSYARELTSSASGQFTPAAVNSGSSFVNSYWWGYGVCPSAASALSEMTSAQVASYVDGLSIDGSTYHDIGMIWGGRMLSPTGIFAAENADVNASRPTTRHMIYITDGSTAPLDISYGSYGIEALDRRRWRPTSAMSLTETVENRFAFACEEVKKRNIQVWVISFGTEANSVMETCAGSDRYFVADDSAALEATFRDIAQRMGELRVTG